MIRYALWFPENRSGEFEFLCHNQSNWSTSLKKVKEAAEEAIQEHMSNYDFPLTREEAMEEIGKPVIYKLTVERV